MNENFYVVKMITFGYQCGFLMYGDEQSVVKEAQRTISAPFTLMSVPRQVASAFVDLGFKIYYCMDTSIQETPVPKEMEQVSIEEFMTNT